jgi:hypothetical protein
MCIILHIRFLVRGRFVQLRIAITSAESRAKAARAYLYPPFIKRVIK